MPDFIDIHSHLNFSQFDADRDQVIRRLGENKTWTITVGTDFPMSEKAVKIAEENEGVFASIGLHPDDSGQGFDEKAYRELAQNKKVVAIGECGLDYFVTPKSDEGGSEGEVKNKNLQINLFEKQIELAVKSNLPLMIHSRPKQGTQDAYEDIHDVLLSHSKKYGEKIRGNMHFFAADVSMARKFLDLGFTLSFTGVITFARSYDEVIRFAPIDRIMSGTDSPFVSPEPHRGRRNEPSYVKEVVKKIAQIRDDDFETVKLAMVSNAIRLFKFF